MVIDYAFIITNGEGVGKVSKEEWSSVTRG
jgi:hypothetical protein